MPRTRKVEVGDRVLEAEWMGDAYEICDVPLETIEDLTFREPPEDVIFKFAKAPVPAPRTAAS